MRTNILNKKAPGAAISEEELKIRSELEMDIERDLEEEIKDGIYRHALRLHRFYQQQKGRSGKEVPGLETQGRKLMKSNKTLLEVNISIRMEGGSKIEIKETKKESTPEKVRPRTSRSENMQSLQLFPNTKKFDWVKTLRSNAGPVVIPGRNGSLLQPKPPTNNRCRHLSLDLKNARRIGAGATGDQPKVPASIDKLLESGWKN